MRYLTNAATDSSVVLTVATVGKLAGLYLVLRIIDGAASYYMSGTGTSWACTSKPTCAGTLLPICSG